MEGIEKMANDINEKIDALKSNMVTPDQFSALKSEIETLKGTDKHEELTAKLLDLAGEIQTIKDNGTAESKNNAFEKFEKEYKENLNEIQSAKTTGTIMSFEIKAVDPVLTSNVSAQAGGNVVAMTQSLGFVVPTADNRLFAEGIMNAVPVELDTLTWIDEVAKEGDAGMTSEGGTKSQSDVTYIERTVNLENVTHFIKVSTKMLAQPSYIVNAVRSRLLRKLQLKKQQQLLSGDGTAPDIKGIKEWATAFAAGDYAGSVIEPNINDLIRVLVGQIAENGEDFMPNYAIVSHKTLADMDLKKASDGHYVLPPFSTLDNRTISGVRVIASNEFTNDELIVGDFTKANYAFKNSVQVSINLDGNDFTKNMRTILAEQPIALFVSSNETGAFILVDDIAEALSEIAVAEPSV
jgi:HK97 family phage major capsid protein